MLGNLFGDLRQMVRGCMVCRTVAPLAGQTDTSDLRFGQFKRRFQ